MKTKTTRPPSDGKVAVYRRFVAHDVEIVARNLHQLIPAVEGFEFTPANRLLLRVADVLRYCDDSCVDTIADYLFNASRKAEWPPNGVVRDDRP